MSMVTATHRGERRRLRQGRHRASYGQVAFRLSLIVLGGLLLKLQVGA